MGRITGAQLELRKFQRLQQSGAPADGTCLSSLASRLTATVGAIEL